jgi:hypothetical protein
MRMWRNVDGTAVMGEFEKALPTKILIRDPSGESHLMEFSQLSDPDQEYILHAAPPKIDIECRNHSRQRPFLEWSIDEDVTTLYSFEIKLKREGKLLGKRTLTTELFVVGEEVDSDNYMLVHWQKAEVVFPEGSKSSQPFTVTDVPFRYYYASWARHGGAAKYRGVTYLGYLIAVSDSKGNLIATDADMSKLRVVTDDIPAAVTALRQIYMNGRGSVYSRCFDESLKKKSASRMPWHPRDRADF